MTKYKNVNDYDERGFPPPVPPGTYTVKVDDIREVDKDGQAYKDDGVLVIFKIKGHPGNSFTDFFFPEPSGEFEALRGGLLKKFLIAIGCSTEGGDISEWLHKECLADLKVVPYKGEQQNKARTYEPIESDHQKFKADEDLPF